MKEFKVTDSILPDEQVFNRIVIIRGQRVIIDYDLAELYCIEVKVLKQAVRRNLSRFQDSRKRIMTLKYPFESITFVPLVSSFSCMRTSLAQSP